MMRSACGFVVGLASFCALPVQQAAAEVHVDFLFGGGSYGYHHHHHHHRPYGYGWWYYPRVDYVYLPPPVTYVPVAPPVAVVPQYGASSYAPSTQGAAAAPTLPTSSTNSAATTTKPAATPTNTLPEYRGRGVTLRNPASTGTSVAFLLDGRTEMELAPGEVSPLREKGTYLVEFDRGADFGTARRELAEGAYEFTATAEGWDLRRMPTPGNAPAVEPLVRRNVLPSSSAR